MTCVHVSKGETPFLTQMASPCTIATATKAISLCRSVILRPTLASSAASAAVAIMSNRHDHTAATTDLDALAKQKRTVRFRVKKELKNMDSALRAQEDIAIQNIVLESPWFKCCKRLCAYISCDALREVNTLGILSDILQNRTKDGHSLTKKKLYVPRVEDSNRNMRMLNISTMDDLIANSMKILEPAPVDAEGNERENVLLAEDPVDLLLLPGLAFDKTGRRLGRGGGYYDTFLMKYQELAMERKWKQPLLVALSYSVQILEEGVIPITPTDVFVDALVTPSGVIPITPAAKESCN